MLFRSLPDGRVVLRVAFAHQDSVRWIAPARLDDVEPVFAMTVHKSQGSEYGSLVVAALPGESSPLLTRELFYTAVTRAKRAVIVVGSEESIRASVRNESSRDSGIAAMIGALSGPD